jgi:penicillin-binding protein 1A
VFKTWYETLTKAFRKVLPGRIDRSEDRRSDASASPPPPARVFDPKAARKTMPPARAASPVTALSWWSLTSGRAWRDRLQSLRDWGGREWDWRASLERLAASPIGRNISRAMLSLDSWIDSSIFQGGQGTKETYEAFAMFMDRFYVSGRRRVAVELACEAMTLGCGAGILALALAVPAFQQTSDDWLKKQDLAVTFLDRFGQEVGRRGIRHDDAVPFDELPRNLIQAVISTEDRRFFDHFGIDIIGTLRAITVNARANGVVQGGSSLTQQLAKNLFLSNERTVQRKINEAFLALWLEARLTKREILGLYLDRAYLGGGTFGVQAASEFYFGKSVRDLTLPEAAMIAGLFKAPTKYAPHINLPAARARANDVLNNMVEAGYLTQGQIYAALRNPATPVDRQRENSPDWYLDWAFNEIKAMAEAGKFGDERVLTVRLALDPNLQRHAEETIENQLREFGPAYHAKQSATVVLDPTGAVRAIVGGRDYGGSQFNRATEALRQPGSSFKPFVYLTALMTGKFHPNTIISGGPVCIGNWCPHNFKGESAGPVPLVTALMKSLNTVAVRLSIMIGNGSPKAGRAKIVETARRMGITTPLEDTVSLPLGADVVNVMEMASAYAAFANGGKRVPPYAAVSISTGRGDVIYRHDRDQPPPEQVVDANAVSEMNWMLRQNVLGGTGRRAAIEGHEAAGKTGTTNSYKDAWFVGFTGNYVAAVWFGNDDDSPMKDMTGGTLPAATWHDIMTYAHENVEPKPIFGVSPSAPLAHVAAAAPEGSDAGAPRPVMLSRGTTAALGAIDQSIEIVQVARMPPKATLVGRSSAVADESAARIIDLR